MLSRKIVLELIEKSVFADDEAIMIKMIATSADITSSFFTLCIRTSEFVLCLLLMTAKLALSFLPQAMQLGRVIFEFHRTQLEPSDIAIEFGSITLIIVTLLLRKKIFFYWNRLENHFKSRYRLAVKYGPHIAFFVTSVTLSILGRKILVPLANSVALPLVILIYPFVQTIKRLISKEELSYSLSLKYWIIASLYFATRSLLQLIPFSSWIGYYVSVLQVLVLIVAIWIQCSSICVDIVYDAASPILAYYVDKIPAADFSSKYLKTFLNGLKLIRVLDDRKIEVIEGIIGDGISLIICVVTFFTPARIATVGLVAISAIIPAFRSSKLIKFDSAAKDSPSLRFGAQEFYLQYWCCFALIGLYHIQAITYPSIFMILYLWLQHSYFSGAAKVFLFTETNISAIRERHKNTQALQTKAIDEHG